MSIENNNIDLSKIKDIQIGKYKIECKKRETSALFFDLSNPSMDSNVKIIADKESKFSTQNFIIYKMKDNNGNLQNVILSEYSAKVFDMARGTDLIQFLYHGGSNQQWRFLNICDDYYAIESIESKESNKFLHLKDGKASIGTPIVIDRYIPDDDSFLFQLKRIQEHIIP